MSFWFRLFLYEISAKTKIFSSITKTMTFPHKTNATTCAMF